MTCHCNTEKLTAFTDEALKAPEAPHPSPDMLTKSQERQHRKKANREAKLKAQDLATDSVEDVQEQDQQDRQAKQTHPDESHSVQMKGFRSNGFVFYQPASSD